MIEETKELLNTDRSEVVMIINGQYDVTPRVVVDAVLIGSPQRTMRRLKNSVRVVCVWSVSGIFVSSLRYYLSLVTFAKDDRSRVRESSTSNNSHYSHGGQCD